MTENDGKYSGEGYTGSQKETYDLIKSLHESGLGYRRIAHYRNSKNITTFSVKEWKGNYIKQIIGISSLLFVMVITFFALFIVSRFEKIVNEKFISVFTSIIAIILAELSV